MQVTSKKVGSAVFLDLAGNLTVDADTKDLHAAVRRLARRGVQVIVADIANVTRLDCSGIGQLIEIRNLVSESGATFGLLNVEPRHRLLLELLRVPEVCKVLDTTADAYAGARPRRKRARRRVHSSRPESPGWALPLAPARRHRASSSSLSDTGSFERLLRSPD